MVSSVQSKVESFNDLLLFARLHEIDESLESLKKLWQERPEPIKAGPQNSDIAQIIRVWRKNGSTYALLNDGTLYIISDSEYDNGVMREGTYFYKDCLLLIRDMRNVLPYIKYLDKLWGPHHELRLRERQTLREERLQHFHFHCSNTYFLVYTEEALMEALASEGYIAPTLKCSDPEANKERLERFKEDFEKPLKTAEFAPEVYKEQGVSGGKSKSSKEKLEGGTDSITEDALLDDEDGWVYQVMGKKLHEWVTIPETDPENSHYTQQDWIHYLGDRMSAGLKYYLDDGTHGLRLGNFELDYTIKTEKKKRKYYFDGVEVQDLWNALVRLKDYEDKENFLKHMNEPRDRRQPVKADPNLKVKLFLRPDEEIPVVLKLEKRKGRWLLEFPGSDKAYHIKDGKKKLSELLHGEYYEWRPVEVLFFVKTLRQYVPEEELMTHVERLIQNVRVAEEKAEANLKKFLGEHRDGVREGEFEVERGTRRGYIVKGKKRNYFVWEKNGYTVTYPQGASICLHDENEALPRPDKILNRILLTLNDDKLSDEVSTI